MKYFNPVHNSMRGLSLISRDILAKEPSEKARHLIFGRKRIAARNNAGRITVRYRGGAHKKRMRTVDFKRYNALAHIDDNITSKVISIEYDPNRSAFLALLESRSVHNEGDDNGSSVFYNYIIASTTMRINDEIVCSRVGGDMNMNDGNSVPLSQIRIGLKVYNIELKHGSGAVIARSAGSYAEVVGRDSGFVLLKLRSGEVRLVQEDCFATIGIASNIDHKNESFAKAGRKRWMGIRPHVRGVAMNPIDHPHGGGEGKTSGGRHPVTPWGKPTKGKKTRRKKWSDKLIKSF